MTTKAPGVPATGASPATTIIAPAQLTQEHRSPFREQALECVARAAAAGHAEIGVDLGDTTETDATGIGVLVLLQKRARERGLSVRLLRVPPRIWSLLKATRLDLLFPTAVRAR